MRDLLQAMALGSVLREAGEKGPMIVSKHFCPEGSGTCLGQGTLDQNSLWCPVVQGQVAAWMKLGEEVVVVGKQRRVAKASAATCLGVMV